MLCVCMKTCAEKCVLLRVVPCYSRLGKKQSRYSLLFFSGVFSNYSELIAFLYFPYHTLAYSYFLIIFSTSVRFQICTLRDSVSFSGQATNTTGERSPRRANGLTKTESDLSDLGLKVPEVVLPRKGLDLTKWCVIACDQYTSQPQYWESVKNFVKDEPSTLNLIFPEVYLGDAKTNQQIIRGINDKMCEYERDRVLEALDPGFVLIDRQTPHVASRKGVSAASQIHIFHLHFISFRSSFFKSGVCFLFILFSGRKA